MGRAVLITCPACGGSRQVNGAVPLGDGFYVVRLDREDCACTQPPEWWIAHGSPAEVTFAAPSTRHWPADGWARRPRPREVRRA